jgi:hypothetical protein
MIYKTYKAINGAEGVIKLNDDNTMSSFLLGLDNPEEKSYLAWVEQGGIPISADE